MNVKVSNFWHTQRRVQPDQCYFTVQITGINFECSFQCNSTVIVGIALLITHYMMGNMSVKLPHIRPYVSCSVLRY